jgi:hypothetical protein
MFFARLEEKDRSRGRDLPRDRVSDRDVGNLFIVRKHDLGRGADHPVDLDDIGRIICDSAHSGVALPGGRLLQRQGRLGKSKHQDHQ